MTLTRSKEAGDRSKEAGGRTDLRISQQVGMGHVLAQKIQNHSHHEVNVQHPHLDDDHHDHAVVFRSKYLLYTLLRAVRFYLRH